MSEEVDETVQNSTEGISHQTTCDHFYTEATAQDANSNLLSVSCINCWSGASIDPAHNQLINGKIMSKEA